MSAPRLWFPMDVRFRQQDVVRSLQGGFGPAGPWVFLWLLGEAYERHFLKERPSGVVDMSYLNLATAAGVEAQPFETAEEIVRGIIRNLEVAQVVEFMEGDLESVTFRLRFSKWADWLPSAFADPTATERKRTQRAKEALDETDDADVTECHAKRERETKSPTAPVREDVARLSALLAELIRSRDPKAAVAPTSKPWLDAIRLLLDKNKRTEAEVEHVIRWCQHDDFWQKVILSAPKLRLKFDMLFAKAGKPKGNADDFFSRNGM